MLVKIVPLHHCANLLSRGEVIQNASQITGPRHAVHIVFPSFCLHFMPPRNQLTKYVKDHIFPYPIEPTTKSIFGRSCPISYGKRCYFHRASRRARLFNTRLGHELCIAPEPVFIWAAPATASVSAVKSGFRHLHSPPFWFMLMRNCSVLAVACIARCSDEFGFDDFEETENI